MRPDNTSDRPPLGVICLDSAFPKPPGHIRNPATFHFPLICHIVRGATIERLINRMDRSLSALFVDAARQLEALGVAAITGSCGFMILFQQEIADAVKVPVFMSSLIQIPLVQTMLQRDQVVGILTANRECLTHEHLRAAAIQPESVEIAGLEGQDEFRSAILEGRRKDLDFDKLESEIVEVASDLVTRFPSIGAIVLECTDLPFAARKISQQIHRPVFDIVSLAEMVYRAARPCAYPSHPVVI